MSRQTSIEETAKLIVEKRWIEPLRAGCFRVSSLDASGALVEYRVTRNFRNEPICNCPGYRTDFLNSAETRCEHLLAAAIYQFGEARALSGDGLHIAASDPSAPANWRCHHLTRKRIEKLIAQLVAEGIEKNTVISEIRRKSGDRAAPESLLQEAAERVEEILIDWLMDLEAARMAENSLAA